jgi:WASH complex subunit FAM21
MLNKINEAVQIGISIMDKYFQKLDGKDMNRDGDDDDDDDEDDDLVIYEAKDPYILRSLPYLIGSPLYLENDHVGLRDDFDGDEKVSEDDDEDDDVDENGKVEQSTDDDSDESDESEKNDLFDNKKEHNVAVSNNHDDDDDDDDGDLFKTTKSIVCLILESFYLDLSERSVRMLVA